MFCCLQILNTGIYVGVFFVVFFEILRTTVIVFKGYIDLGTAENKLCEDIMIRKVRFQF